MFFEDWFSVVRVVVVGAAAYAALVLFIRLFGKRTLSKMNAFDLIVTVALGSTLATVIISKDVKLLEGLVALLLLCSLQFIVAYASVRLSWVERLVKSEPTLLFHRGRFLHQAMKHERVTQDEIRAAARSQGVHDLNEIAAAVLEADGSLSIVQGTAGDRSSLPERAA